MVRLLAVKIADCQAAGSSPQDYSEASDILLGEKTAESFLIGLTGLKWLP